MTGFYRTEIAVKINWSEIIRHDRNPWQTVHREDRMLVKFLREIQTQNNSIALGIISFHWQEYQNIIPFITRVSRQALKS